MRTCASCNLELNASSFSANQRSKGPGRSRCAACVHGHHNDRPLQKAPDSGHYNASNHCFISANALQEPFAEGAFRCVSKGVYTSGPRQGQTCVAKWFKTGAVFGRHYFTVDLKAVYKALDIVDKFRQLNVVGTSIRVNVAEVWELKADCADQWAGQKALCEPFIDNYQKFNSNTGWSDSMLACGQAMQALSHFSYHVTGGQYVLCDLQGGISQSEVVLSDPVILSRDGSYGVADLGPKGIESFFSQHLCNDSCRPNWIRPLNPVQHYDPVARTTMSRHSVPA